MTADLSFAPAPRMPYSTTFAIGDDHVYQFTAPKFALLTMPVLTLADDMTDSDSMRLMFDWLGSGLSEEDNQRIIARLQDPADPLDIDYFRGRADATDPDAARQEFLRKGLIRTLIERSVVARPTTSPSGSPSLGSDAGSPSMDGPQPVASTPQPSAPTGS